MADISMLDAVNMNNQRIKQVASPQTGTDAANADYVDAAIRGLDWKQEVVAASTGNVSLSAPGGTLDGVTLTNPSRVLLKDQTAQAENGTYLWTGAGVALTRTTDADTWTKLTGATVTVQRGTVNADRVYRVTADDGGTLGTTAVTLAQVGAGGTSYTGSSGVTVSGSVISLDTAVAVRKVNFNVGDGTSTQIDLVHGLGTRDVKVEVVRNSSPWETLRPGVERPDVNTVRLTFAVAPTTNQYRASVQG